MAAPCPEWIQPIHDVTVLRCGRCGQTKVLRLPKDKLFEVRARMFIAMHLKCEDKSLVWKARP